MADANVAMQRVVLRSGQNLVDQSHLPHVLGGAVENSDTSGLLATVLDNAKRLLQVALDI